MHHDLVQPWQGRLQAREDPAAEHLAGGVLQALDVVEEVVIELVVQRREGRLDVGEVHHPAHRRIGFALDVDLDPERMTVQPGTLMAGRHVRQAVGRLDMEFFEDMHARILPRQAGPPRPFVFRARGGAKSWHRRPFADKKAPHHCGAFEYTQWWYGCSRISANNPRNEAIC